MDEPERVASAVMDALNLFARIGCGVLIAAWLVSPAAAQPSADWVKITAPQGMRWKSRDQSTVTSDVIFVDSDGNQWVRKSAAAQFSNTFILVQLVGIPAVQICGWIWSRVHRNIFAFVGIRTGVSLNTCHSRPVVFGAA